MTIERPPYSLSPKTLSLCVEIGRLLGQYEGLRLPKPQPRLRRTNKIRSIQSSLAIEGNSLSFDQVSALLENKRVVGPKRDILEVQNAIRVYDRIREYSPLSEKSFLQAQAGLLAGLVPDAGRWRRSGIGVMEGSKIIHVAPKADRVPALMAQLFEFLRSTKKDSPLTVSSVFHYEVEFIHPFSDGNGRMGRLWQHALLTQYHPLFEYIPVESVIRKYQREYYRSLRLSDSRGESTAFIEFCLESIREGMKDFLDELKPEPLTPESRLELARSHFEGRSFLRKDYLKFFKTLSTATASRDLRYGVVKKLLKRSGDKALSSYHYL